MTFSSATFAWRRAISVVVSGLNSALGSPGPGLSLSPRRKPGRDFQQVSHPQLGQLAAARLQVLRGPGLAAPIGPGRRRHSDAPGTSGDFPEHAAGHHSRA
jgi:hypothetical protein